MTRSGLLALAGAGLCVAATAGISILREGTLSTTGIPLFRVERGAFVQSATAEGFLRAAEVTPITVPAEVPGAQRIAWTVPDGSTVRRGEVVIRLDTDSLEAALADGAGELEQSELRAADAEESGGNDRRKLTLDTETAEREAEQAEEFAPRDPAIYSRAQILDSAIDIDLAREKVSNLRRRGDAALRRDRNQEELLGIDRALARSKLQQARKGLSAAEIRAPHDGLLVLDRGWEGDFLEPGAEVWPGQTLAEIPDPGRLEAVAYVLEADATGLKPGCRATVKVDAHPGTIVAGRVERVDPLAKSRDRRVPVQYFEVSLSLEGVPPAVMKPGLRVVSEIVLREKPGVLMIPPQAVFPEGGRDTVFRKQGKALVPVEVRLEDRGLSRVVVARGLKEGDEVALRDPRQGLRRIPPPRTSGGAAGRAPGPVP